MIDLHNWWLHRQKCELEILDEFVYIVVRISNKYEGEKANRQISAPEA